MGLKLAGSVDEAAGLLFRLAPASVFLVHGWLKLLGGHHDLTVALFLTVGVPLAEAAAWGIGVLELMGGFALLTGVLIRPAAGLLAIEMAVAIAVVRLPQGFLGGWEFEFVLLLICLGLALSRTGARRPG